MGFNEHCIYQTCAGGCCNFYGDCPEWYSNSNSLYTQCYYYYATDTTALLITVIASLAGVLLLSVAMALCYKHYRKEAVLLNNQLREVEGQSMDQF